MRALFINSGITNSSPLTPSQLYQDKLLNPAFKADPLQLAALQQLDALYARVLAPKHWLNKKAAIKGLYLWGQVGIGKSFLVNLFFECLPEIGKTRQHYQHFMARVHRELHAITGQANPLKLIGQKLAQEYKVICLDELYITDLGDAMIVTQLFESMFNAGVVLLITSNFAPDKLYKDELQPMIFAPAIRLISTNTEELHLASEVDYRKLQVGQHATWFVHGEQDFAQLFTELQQQLHATAPIHGDSLLVNHHQFHPKRYCEQLVWFSFDELCNRPRSAHDYIALGQRFKYFLVSDVPQFGSEGVENRVAIGTEDALSNSPRRHFSSSENAQRRFISLVDELYDQGIKLYVLADVPLADIYAGGKLAFEFQRTISRLTEMQSATYRDRAVLGSTL
jgi:cell division protein ZapE